jgi:hypothetical protein
MYPSKILTAAVLAATAAATLAAATTAGAADARTQGSPVQVVRPGQVVDTGHGIELELTFPRLTVTVYDARGAVMASLTSPAST